MARAKKEGAAKKPATPRKRKVKAEAGSVGLTAEEVAADSPPGEITSLEKKIEAAGGKTLAAYREPLGGHWVALAALPLDKVKPTPYQRELSKAHAERLASVIPKVGRFLDPVIAVPDGDAFITPNGMHRLAALGTLGAKTVVALVMPEHEIAFRILALKEIMKNPAMYGFTVAPEEMYPLLPVRKVEVDTSIVNLATFAQNQGINYKILKIHNPWLRDRNLPNAARKKYVIDIPTSGY